MKVYATYNIKGGVGKTSTAVNLAYLAAASGRRVLLWDPQGAATFDLVGAENPVRSCDRCCPRRCSTGWAPSRLHPASTAPLWKMDAFRDKFLGRVL